MDPRISTFLPLLDRPLHLRAKARKLWLLVREKVKNGHFKSCLPLLDSDDFSYQVILKQGFLHQKTLKHLHTIVSICYHWSSLKAQNENRFKQAEDLQDVVATSQPKPKSMTMVTTDRSGKVHTWRWLSNSYPKKQDELCVPCKNEIQNLVYLVSINLYAACYVDTVVKVCW